MLFAGLSVLECAFKLNSFHSDRIRRREEKERIDVNNGEHKSCRTINIDLSECGDDDFEINIRL